MIINNIFFPLCKSKTLTRSKYLQVRTLWVKGSVIDTFLRLSKIWVFSTMSLKPSQNTICEIYVDVLYVFGIRRRKEASLVIIDWVTYAFICMWYVSRNNVLAEYVTHTTHTHSHTYIHTHSLTHTRTHIHTHTYKHTHTHIHT